jgi:D-glycero-D-manno-heptose 1,7-bisphosphate phosphatase
MLEITGVFFDRDGVLVEEVPYLSQALDVVVIPEVVQAVAHLTKQGVPSFIVTNQSGIGRGRFTVEDYEAVQSNILANYLKEGAEFKDVRFASCAPDATEGVGHAHPDLRKPNPGMILDLANVHEIELTNSVMVGNCFRDVLAGYHAGCKHLLFFEPRDQKELDQYEQCDFRDKVVICSRDSILEKIRDLK